MAKLYGFVFLVELLTAAFWSCWSAALIGAGYSISSTAMLLASFYVAQTIFEIPTGYFADRHGRKLSTLLGLLCIALGFLLVGVSGMKTIATLGFFLTGIGLTLNSGARTSWLLGIANSNGFATAKDGTEKFFLNINLIGRVATILGAFGGVELLKLSPQGFWYSSFAVSLLSMFFGLLALPSDKLLRGRIKFQLDFADLKNALRSSSYALAVTSILFFGVETGIRNLINQPYVLELSSGNSNYLAYFQAILAVVRIGGIFFYRALSSSVREKVGRHFLVFPLVLFALAELFASQAQSFWSFIPVYGLAVFALGWHFPLRDAFINSLIPESMRATLLSFDSMVMSFGSATILLALGGAPLNLRLLWIVGAVMLTVSSVALWRSHAQIKTEG